MFSIDFDNTAGLLVISKVLQWKTKKILTVFKPGKECDKENRLAPVVPLS
jgi:hypothetical protein